jgi:hypothetical protein
MSLTREQILATGLTPTPVECPEWGGAVFVRPMSLDEWLAFRPLLKTDRDVTAPIVAMCACDESGGRLFDQDEAEALAAKHGVIMQRIALKALEINGLTTRPGEDPKLSPAEGAEKKSETPPSSP